MQLRLLRHMVFPLPAAAGDLAVGFVRVQIGKSTGAVPLCANSAVSVMQGTRPCWPPAAMRTRSSNNPGIWSLNARERVSPETEGACTMAALIRLSIAAAYMTLSPEKLMPQ